MMDLLERIKSLYIRRSSLDEEFRQREMSEIQSFMGKDQPEEVRVLWNLLAARDLIDTQEQYRALELLDATHDLAIQYHSSYWLSEIDRLRARVLADGGDSEAAFQLLVKASAEAQATENYWSLSMITYSLGVNSANGGDYDGASLYLTRGLELAEQGKLDPGMRAHTHLILAQAQLERGAKQEALYHATKSLNGYKDLGSSGRITVAASLLVSVNIELNELAAARQVMASISFEGAAPVQLVSLLNLRAKLRSLEGSFQEAHVDHDAAIVLAREIGVHRLTTNSIQLKCETLLLQGQADDALQLLKTIAVESAAGYDLLSLHELRGKALEQLSQFKEAFEELKKFAILQKELLSERASNALSRLRAAQEVLQAEREAAHFRERSQFYAKELSQRTSYLVQQNTYVSEVIDHLKLLSIKRPDAIDLLKEIQKKLRQLPAATFDWEEYLRLFDEIHPNAIATLKLQYPELTETEAKICSFALAKLTNVEIGRLLTITERAVENHRHRLRKKLGLAAGVDLTAFLERTLTERAAPKNTGV